MATEAYRTWVARGRPFTVARPIRELVAYAQKHGVRVLGTIGDTGHLTADYPEDHTPFSRTAWPLPLTGYVVTACDLEGGAWVGRFLDECRSGQRPWVKYVNHAGQQYNVKNGWVPRRNSDRHFHVSCRTDHLHSSAGLDPWRDADAPPATKKRRTSMLLYHKAGTKLYALAGSSPGTLANWIETEDYDGLAVPWAVRVGDAITLSPDTWDMFKRQFLSPLEVIDR